MFFSRPNQRIHMRYVHHSDVFRTYNVPTGRWILFLHVHNFCSEIKCGPIPCVDWASYRNRVFSIECVSVPRYEILSYDLFRRSNARIATHFQVHSLQSNVVFGSIAPECRDETRCPRFLSSTFFVSTWRRQDCCKIYDSIRVVWIGSLLLPTLGTFPFVHVPLETTNSTALQEPCLSDSCWFGKAWSGESFCCSEDDSSFTVGLFSCFLYAYTIRLNMFRCFSLFPLNSCMCFYEILALFFSLSLSSRAPRMFSLAYNTKRVERRVVLLFVSLKRCHVSFTTMFLSLSFFLSKYCLLHNCFCVKRSPL